MELFANRVWATLASGMDETQTNLYLTTGHGARFGTIGASDKIRIVLLDASKNVSEVMYATARVGDTLTVDRGQDGTVGVVHLAGDRLEHRIGKSTMDSLTQKAEAGTDAVAEMHAATSKATPADADEFMAGDSAATFGLIRFTWANIKATLLDTWKDATGGLVGLTLFKINFKNAANTITSFFTNANTVARTYTFQDRDGTILDDADFTTLTDSISSLSGVYTPITYTEFGSPLTTDNTLSAADSGKCFMLKSGNTTLPAAVDGLRFKFIGESPQTGSLIASSGTGMPDQYVVGTGGVIRQLGLYESIEVYAYGGSWYVTNISGQKYGVDKEYQVFTASGTWTKPSNLNPNARVLIECWGGGGGGSSVSTDGGGGGAYASRIVLASQMGATETVTVGAGGTTGNPGANGGLSSVGSLISAGGGGGGKVGYGGGAGGGGTSADHHTPGAAVTSWSINFKDTVSTEAGAPGTGSATPSTYGSTTGGGGGGQAGTGYGTGSYYGGGGGTSDGPATGGPSLMAGAGGGTGLSGNAPAGGGGQGGNGARGEVRIRILG